MPALKERAKTLVDLLQAARFIMAPVPPDEKAAGLLDEAARARLARLAAALADVDWEAAALEAAVRDFAEKKEGVKLGAVAQPLRAALTGSASSPPIFDVLAVLGREESLARVSAQSRAA
jgi:glutamyl-tRNA synthetase